MSRLGANRRRENFPYSFKPLAPPAPARTLVLASLRASAGRLFNCTAKGFARHLFAATSFGVALEKTGSSHPRV